MQIGFSLQNDAKNVRSSFYLQFTLNNKVNAILYSVQGEGQTHTGLFKSST